MALSKEHKRWYRDMLKDLLIGISTDYCGHASGFTAFDAINIYYRKLNYTGDNT